MNRPDEIDFEAILNGTVKPKVDHALESRKRIKILIQSYQDRRLMSADEQIHWQNASRSHGSAGTSCIFSGDGSRVHGDMYCFDGKEYIQSEEGVYDSESRVFISDATVKESIAKLEAEDKKINQSRDWIAKQYSEGDSTLEMILRAHLEFEGGKIHPYSHEGILFFQVGQNSSHQFYVGTRDGKTYRLSVGEEYDEAEEGDDEDGNHKDPIGRTAYNVSELGPEEGWGYVGHY